MTYNALRTGRHSAAGQVYHITTVTKNRVPVFSELDAGRLLVRELMTVQAEGLAETLCYVVMPDHLHWLLALQGGGSLATLMQRVKGRSAHRISRLFWQAGFYDHAVRQDEDLRATARYLVANPLRAGLVGGLGDYPLWDAAWLGAGDSTPLSC